jgi:hypothetical protein
MQRRLRGTPRIAYPRYAPPPSLERPTPLRRETTPQLPGHDLDERTTTGEGLRLIPLETHDTSRYRRQDPRIAPPWKKDAYRDPERDRS